MRIGVARVSTHDQNPESQEDALRATGCEKVFTDKASGKLARRPELDKALLVAPATATSSWLPSSTGWAGHWRA